MTKKHFIKMKLFNAVVCMFLICLTNCVKAQTFYKCQIRLLSSSKQITEGNANYFSITKAIIDGKQIKLTLSDKTKLIVSTDTVWGYKIMDNNHIIRAYNGGLYQVSQTNNLILYTQKDYGSEFFASFYYFSYTFDSEIHLIDKSNIRKTFADNDCILQKLKSIKAWQYPTDWDEKCKTIRFMTWYDECNLKK